MLLNLKCSWKSQLFLETCCKEQRTAPQHIFSLHNYHSSCPHRNVECEEMHRLHSDHRMEPAASSECPFFLSKDFKKTTGDMWNEVCAEADDGAYCWLVRTSGLHQKKVLPVWSYSRPWWMWCSFTGFVGSDPADGGRYLLQDSDQQMGSAALNFIPV